MNHFFLLLHISSKTFLAPSPPSNLSVSQNGPDSVLVSWIAPSGEPAVTGYIIYYQQHDGEQCLSESAGPTANIIGLIVGATYSITIMATSSTLPSTETAALNVTIGTRQPLILRYSMRFV